MIAACIRRHIVRGSRDFPLPLCFISLTGIRVSITSPFLKHPYPTDVAARVIISRPLAARLHWSLYSPRKQAEGYSLWLSPCNCAWVLYNLPHSTAFLISHLPIKPLDDVFAVIDAEYFDIRRFATYTWCFIMNFHQRVMSGLDGCKYKVY